MKHDSLLNKKKLLECLEKHLGLVSPACKEAGLSRETFYKYYREDPDFKLAVDELNEITLDFAEAQLLKKIKEGSERSILFYMRYKARKRGYTDHLDITSDGKSITEIKLIHIKNKNDDEIDGEDTRD
jgi:hypothetical protein